MKSYPNGRKKAAVNKNILLLEKKKNKIKNNADKR